MIGELSREVHRRIYFGDIGDQFGRVGHMRVVVVDVQGAEHDVLGEQLGGVFVVLEHHNDELLELLLDQLLAGLAVQPIDDDLPGFVNPELDEGIDLVDCQVFIRVEGSLYIAEQFEHVMLVEHHLRVLGAAAHQVSDMREQLYRC